MNKFDPDTIGMHLKPFKHALQATFEKTVEAYDSGGRDILPQTGLKNIDVALGGLPKEGLVVLSSKPEDDSLMLALQMALFTSQQDQPNRKSVAMFSCMRNRGQVAESMLEITAMVSWQKARRGELNREQWESITKSAAVLAELPIWFTNSNELTTETMREELRQYRWRKDIPEVGLVIVDNLQMLEGDVRLSTRFERLDLILRDLKGLAFMMHAPVIVTTNEAIPSGFADVFISMRRGGDLVDSQLSWPARPEIDLQIQHKTGSTKNIQLHRTAD